MRLGEILINHKQLTVEKLESLLSKQQREKKKLGELLLDAELITPEALEKALKEQFWRRNGYWIIG